MARKLLTGADFNGQKAVNLAPGVDPTDAATVSQLGAGGGATNVFVQNATPSTPPATYLWVQTGLGASGTDMTFWIEDGT